ncbi:MAG: diguanylate cyclase [Hydrogenophilales bacterium]|nr:diguanylate cyclase [Hydrogenophilales bacterium]
MGQLKPKILVIDDMPPNLKTLGVALAQEYELYFALSGLEGLELARQVRPDLILLDVMMPGLDGYEVCRLLKEDTSLERIPVIFITAKIEVDDQLIGFNLGAVDYITKPFVMPLVLARINLHMRLIQKAEQLEALAMIDRLTDIPNRRALEVRLDEELARGGHEGKTLALLMIDVDFFKGYNDHYGHGAGDLCLHRIARSLTTNLSRPGDFVGRYGGEEFLAILPDCDEEGAAFVAEKECNGVRELNIPHDYSGGGSIVTISIGCAVGTIQASGSSLIKLADHALYEAKSRGRNQVVQHVL